MIPYYKLFVIGVRTFTKPAIYKLKETSIKYPQSLYSRVLIKIGRKFYVLERRIQRKFLGVKDSTDSNEIKISDEKSLEKSATFLFEVVILYGILIGISLHELNRYTVKQKKLKRNIKEMKEENKNLREQFVDVKAEFEEAKMLLKAQHSILERLVINERKTE